MKRRSWVALFMCALSACSAGRDAPPLRDQRTANAIKSANSAVASTAEQPWDDALGALIALPSADGTGSILLTRDRNIGADVDVELFTHDDRVSRATMRAGAALGCEWAHAATVSSAAGLPAAWALALVPGTARPIAVDALADLSPRDSLELTVRVSRLVNALQTDSATAPFRGLPVVVRDAWTARLPDGTPFVIAVAMRSLNVESNPRAEVITIVAELEAPSSTQWRTVFTRRDAGPEDRMEGADLLAALVVGGDRPMLALLRETDRGPAVDFIERAAVGTWRLRWTTASLPCEH